MALENLDSDISEKTEISLNELSNYLWTKKISLFLTTTFFILLSLAYTLASPNIYTSHTILAPSEQINDLNSDLLSNLNLPSIPGVPQTSSLSYKTLEAVERLKSFDFFIDIKDKISIVPELMASKSYDKKNKKLIYDKNLYSDKKNEWVGEIPSDQEAFYAFKDIYKVSINDDTGYVVISISFISPEISKLWIENIVSHINTKIRTEHQELAAKSIDYLNKQISNTNLSEVRISLSRLIQEETKKLNLTNITDDYIFKTIESPYAPEFKSSPKRLLFVIFGGFIGFFLSLIYLIFRLIYR